MSTETPKAVTRPHATENDIISMAYDLYGLKILRVKKLDGYDDQNFHVTVNMAVNENPHIEKLCDLGYVFKILNVEDSVNQTHISAQIDLMNRLNSQGVPCPVHIRDKTGAVFSEQLILNEERTGKTKHLVRMLEFLEGVSVIRVGVTDDVAYKGGIFVAKFSNAVQGYEDRRIAKENYLWSLSSVPALRDFIDSVQDADNRALCENVIQKWIDLEPEFDKLPDVHHDINEGNLLIKEAGCSGSVDIAGLLDFQDSCYGKRHYDIAVFMAYMMIYYMGQDKMKCGGLCLKGFLQEATLSEVELNLLYYTVVGRLLQSLVLGSYSYSLYKDPYLLSTSHEGWQLLRTLWSKPAQDVLDQWLLIAKSDH